MEDKESVEEIRKMILIWAIALLILIIILIAQKLLTNPDKTKIENFNNNQDLICVSGNADYFKGQKFVISKKRGWNIYNADYVIKDDLIIDLKDCE